LLYEIHANGCKISLGKIIILSEKLKIMILWFFTAKRFKSEDLPTPELPTMTNLNKKSLEKKIFNDRGIEMEILTIHGW